MKLDFRSDTVTVPTEEMRQVIARAPVGDDVWGDDPSVLELEAHVASLCQGGKQPAPGAPPLAALFVVTGVMSNQLALRCHVTQQAPVVARSSLSLVFFLSHPSFLIVVL